MERRATVSRETKETAIKVEINIDGSGKANLMTGIRMFDHMLDQLARHGVFDLQVSATGSDQHHVVEDVAICLGKAFNRALGDKAGLTRMADATVPMDDALAMVALDISGRGWCSLEAPFASKNLGDLTADLIAHFFQSFAAEARVNIHARVLAGDNDHHRAEALFKAFARALDAATRIDPRLEGRIPSTKEVIEG
jgi:imidazoleglycerol-phosphate dehydratase